MPSSCFLWGDWREGRRGLSIRFCTNNDFTPLFFGSKSLASEQEKRWLLKARLLILLGEAVWDTQRRNMASLLPLSLSACTPGARTCQEAQSPDLGKEGQG